MVPQNAAQSVQCFRCNMVAGHADGCPVSPTGVTLRAARHELEIALPAVEALRADVDALHTELEFQRAINAGLESAVAQLAAECERLHAALLRGAA